jgi:transposase
MAITPETEAEIIRLFHAERWRRGTIARQLNIHHSTVDRVLAAAGLGVSAKPRPSKIDPYVPFINETLDKYPKLNSARLYQMVKERGYTGAKDHFRHLIRRLRPKPKGEAYLRLATLPGEQAQVDWGSFGKLSIGSAEHRLLAFVMVLSWSRRIFLRFYLGDKTENFLRGHVDALAEFGAVPREILYDNLKSAVIERVDNAIRFNNDMLKLSAHYRFAAKPVPVARPTSKGRVERTIQYVRTSFFAAREFQDIDHLNQQALEWCRDEAAERRCPGDNSMSVAEAFASESSSMLPLPSAPHPVYERKPVIVGKTPYIRFDGNDYSVPHKNVRQSLLVEATLDVVRVVDGIHVVAEHKRSFDKGITVENSDHIDELAAEKRTAGRARGMTRILNVAPSAPSFFKQAGERGHNMGRLTQLLITLLNLYGSAELEAALAEALAAGTIHSEAVRNILERRRLVKGLPPPVLLRPTSSNVDPTFIITPKSLNLYDRLLQTEEDTE